jgi:hypothetical protein
MNTGISRSAVLLALLAIAGPASAGEPACLAGDVGAADLAAIQSVDASVNAGCDCETFDGSKTRQAADYRRCVLAVVKEAVLAGELRSKCKNRLAKAYKDSTCGRSDDATPCIETRSDGSVRCKVQEPGKCVSVPGRFTRLTCSDAVRCIDAADDSGDWAVDSADSGECRPPVTTTTSTLAPETTTTLAPETTTTTLADATTTTTLADETTTTTLAEESTTTTLMETTTTTTLEEETTTTTSTTTTSTTTSTTTTTLACGLNVPTPVVRIYVSDFRDNDPLERPVLPPDPRANACAPQTLLGGGCGDPYEISLDGTVPARFDASESYVPNACPGTTLSYHWQFFKMPALGGTPYAVAGITGYFQPEVAIQPNSFPEVVGATGAAIDPNWRVLLTVTANQGANPVREVWFKFEYVSSALTLERYLECQSQPDDCHSEFWAALPATEPW